MNPEGHTAEAAQMQEKSEGLPEEHGAPSVQYTTVNISSEPIKDYAAEAAQMQEKSEGLPEEHGAPTVQYTTVNIPSEPIKDYAAWAVQMQGRMEGLLGLPGPAPTVQDTTVSTPPEHPKDYIIWSLCCFLYLNPCCLGLAALILSIKARDRKVVGDLNGARRFGSIARTFNIYATALGSVMVVILLITAIITIGQVHQAINP